MGRQEKKIASEINDLFLQLTQRLWEHIAESHLPSDTVSFTVTEHYLLEFLGKESFASMSKLSGVFHVAPTTMTSIVDRLIKRGFLKRRRARQDRRKVLVALSERGRQWYDHHQYHSLEIVAQRLLKFPDKGKKFSQNLKAIKHDLDSLGHQKS